jgi:tRNA1Val (adenine37-N6)-methyltransferase
MGFKFKQFTIEHDACAMKVGTDSIMLGSWVQTKNAQRILDIGTGSGLLAIMLAQKTQDTCLIDGIDIDAAAILQAKDNAKNCPWATRLTFGHISLQQFPLTTGYDLIVSNPPYFSINISANKIQSTQNRLNARQTIALDHPTLLKEVNKHLSSRGSFYCVLPLDVAKTFIADAESEGLYCTRDLQVQPKQQSPVTRLLLEFSRNQTIKTCKNISIYNHLGHYSKEYMSLCKEYYFNF